MISCSLQIIHLLGLFGMFLSLGGLVLYVMGGGTKADFPFRWVAISHGVFMFLVLLVVLAWQHGCSGTMLGHSVLC